MSKFYVSSKSFAAVICKSLDGKLIVKKFKVDFERKRLIETDNLCWNTKMKVEILATDSVEETLTGQVIPVALVRPEEKSSTITCYIVYIDFDRDQILPMRKFETKLKYIQCVDEDLTCSVNNLFILNGPVVVVCYKSKLFIYYGDQTMILKEFSFDAITLTDGISVCCGQSKVSFRYKDLLESTTLHGQYILFLLIQVKLRCTEHGHEVRDIVNILHFSGKRFTVLNTRHFIPDEYIDCVRSVLLKTITHFDSDLYNSELYLGTSEGYIIHVKNGSLIQCCSLSEQYSVSCIKMSSGLDNDTGILAKTGDNRTEITKTFQVKNKYSGIKHTFLEDFLQNGSFQFLLLKGDVEEGASWVLTDLKTHFLTSEGDKPSKQTESSKSSSTAVKALKARLQRDQILLHDEEAQLRRQSEFITDMFAKQVSLATGLSWKSQTQEPTMVNLIAGSEGKHDGRNQSQTGSKQGVEVKGHWQRTYEDSWCIGVDVVCNSNRSTKVWLDVVLDETYTRTVMMKSSCLTLSGNQNGSLDVCGNQNGSLAVSGNQNGSLPEGNHTMTPRASKAGIQATDIAPAKRQKLTDRVKAKSFQHSESGELKDKMDIEKVTAPQGTVVCVIELPVFVSKDSVTANLILNWTHPVGNIEQYDFDKFDKENKSRVEEESNKGIVGAEREGAEGEVRMEGVHTYCCQKVTLKAEDILHSKYELNFHLGAGSEDESMADFKELRNNQLAWQHIQTAHHLVISSSPGILARFESLLTDTCGFVYNQHYDCYVTMVTALRRVQLQLVPQTSDECRQLSVYTRQTKDLFLTIHHLYCHLPDHTVILPRENSSADIIQKCLPALQKEADFLSHGLTKLLNDHEAENASKDSDDGGVDDMRKVGEKFKRKREKMQKRQNDVIRDEKVKQFIETYKRIQDLTDLAVITAHNSK